MTKQKTAKLLTLLVLGCGFAAVVWVRGGGSGVTRVFRAKPEATPQDAIYAMLDAARQGDVRGFLSSYAGPMAASVRQAAADKTETGFSEYLRQSNAAIKGVAITEPETLTDREVKVRVEYVYEDRNEIQFMFLEKIGNAWKITRVESTERIKTLIPYGTPVE